MHEHNMKLKEAFKRLEHNGIRVNVEKMWWQKNLNKIFWTCQVKEYNREMIK